MRLQRVSFHCHVKGAHKTDCKRRLWWLGSCRQGCLHAPVLSTLLLEGSSVCLCPVVPVPSPPSLGDATGVMEAVAWPRWGGSWSWP